ncbi:hypothetical protein FOZ61_009126 [Perkinsus olseni]|uniref:Uncharacterized protein n=1 Tax=Perkinsus olseni TaxID=32597 RepID=A0A7J6L0Y5_PEROL|nr:hypothetical protein FOZ61_009126 [Perkinsus olseni]
MLNSLTASPSAPEAFPMPDLKGYGKMLYSGTLLPNREWVEAKKQRLLSGRAELGQPEQEEVRERVPLSSSGRTLPPCPALDEALRRGTPLSADMTLLYSLSEPLLKLDLSGCHRAISATTFDQLAQSLPVPLRSLRELNLTSTYFTSSFLLALLGSCRYSLQDLTLEAGRISGAVDGAVAALSSAQALKASSLLTTAGLHELCSHHPQLETLDIGQAAGLTDEEQLSSCLACCEELVSLDISACPGLTDRVLKSIPRSCLQTLRLCYAASGVTYQALVEFVRDCPRLTHLDLTGCECLRQTDAVLSLLSEAGTAKLQELILTRAPDLVDDGKLEKLFPRERVIWSPMPSDGEEPFQLICPLSRGAKKGKGKKKGAKAGGKKKKKKEPGSSSFGAAVLTLYMTSVPLLYARSILELEPYQLVGLCKSAAAARVQDPRFWEMVRHRLTAWSPYTLTPSQLASVLSSVIRVAIPRKSGQRPPAKTAAAHLRDPMRLENVSAEFAEFACKLVEVSVMATSPPRAVLVSLADSLITLGVDPRSPGARYLLLSILSGARSLNPGDSCRFLSILHKTGLPLPEEIVQRVVTTEGEGLDMDELSLAYETTREQALGKWLESKSLQEWTPAVILRVAPCCSSAPLANTIARAALEHRKRVYFHEEGCDLEAFVIGVMHRHAVKQDLHIELCSWLNTLVGRQLATFRQPHLVLRGMKPSKCSRYEGRWADEISNSLLENIARLLDPDRQEKPASAVVLELAVAAAEALALAKNHEITLSSAAAAILDSVSAAARDSVWEIPIDRMPDLLLAVFSLDLEGGEDHSLSYQVSSVFLRACERWLMILKQKESLAVEEAELLTEFLEVLDEVGYSYEELTAAAKGMDDEDEEEDAVHE